MSGVDMGREDMTGQAGRKHTRYLCTLYLLVTEKSPETRHGGNDCRALPPILFHMRTMCS